MNYLRGAFSAASQYYKDLPPINPSTLTGAIDVIVIEHPLNDGGTELACSPFHVRFGKWQVLRPADKKVKVLVNGHPIPFDMKIGEAGEAFFVFETDEDVPDELVTSPLLKATDSEATRTEAPPTGRFAAVEHEGWVKEQLLSTTDTNATSQEPEFLDLNASQSSETEHESASFQPSSLTTSSNHTDGDQEELKKTATTGSHSIISLASKVGEIGSGAAHIITSEGDRFDKLKCTAASIHSSTMSIPHLFRTDKHDSDRDPGDDVLPPMDEQQGQAPDVTYHHDVVLDLSGYHSKEASRQTVIADEWPKEDSRLESNDTETSEASRTPSPISSPDSPGPSSRPLPRATSEPPEYVSSSPPPEYSWEWGSFPQRSPTQERFPDFLRNNGTSSSDTKLVEPKVRAVSPPPRSRSPIPEADNGTLEEDAEDQYRIWLNFEGQRLRFELSLCGESIRDYEPFEVAQQFEAKRISFRRVMNDPQAIESSDLVVRWDEDYIFRSDDSPLLPALVNWRKRTLSSSVKLSPEEPQRASPATRSSTWYRWWSRSRTLADASSTHSDDLSDKPTSNRPSVEHTESTPATSISGTSQKSTVVFPSSPPPQQGKRYAKTLRLTSDQLKALNLKKGANSITFSLSASGQVACTARIFVWDANDYVLVSDIDGTITKSDALGHVFTMIGRDWTHLGVAKLYTDICRNGYKIMYLTSRAIGQADSTRDYLKGIKQNNYQLPEGPVIMSPDRLLTSLHREVIMRKPEMFKMACLRDIQRLFGKTSHNPFYAGFGNRITDALSYRSVNIPSGRIFTIDSSGEVKMELLELAGYKSSYIHMTDLVDQMFPPINRKWAPEYTDFNYWRAPMAKFELPEEITRPPSPALTARSDNSTQTTLSRLRNFSLGRPTRAQFLEGSVRSSLGQEDTDDIHVGHVRSAKSLDRFGSFAPNGEGMEYDGYSKGRSDSLLFVPNGIQGDNFRSRQRPESMPGSLDLSGMQDPRYLKADGDEEHEDDEDEDDDSDMGEDAEDAEDVAFDDDLLATGEMETVPFL